MKKIGGKNNLHKQLMNFLDENKLLSRRQFDFRAKMSIELAATLIDDIRRNMDKGQLAVAVFIDLNKASNTVIDSKLLTKLSPYCIDGKELSWFEDYLFNRSAQISFNDVLSDAQYLKFWCSTGLNLWSSALCFIL